MSDIIKCKYAGDPEDEFCRECDGLHPIDDRGDSQVATECGGYEPEEQVQTQPADETPAEINDNQPNSCDTAVPDKECVKGVASVIRAESGVSREVNGTWYKFMFSEERILPAGCDTEAEKQALWDSVNAEVDAQLDAIIN